MIDLPLAIFVLFALHSLGSSYGSPLAPCCIRPSMAQIFLQPRGDEVVVGELVNSVSLVPRVVELNESYNTLEQTLNALRSNAVPKDESNVMLLFYASWCPFSKVIRPVFDTMSSIYPSVYHIAVEESNVRPSVLFKYGVNSFPTLIHLTSNSKARFHGSKNLKNLLHFYKDMTGLDPEIHGSSAAMTLHSGKGRSPAGVCPYPQAISPEKLLQDDMYLTLAACFLALRLACLLLPVAAKRFKWWWDKLVATLSFPFQIAKSSLSPRSSSLKADADTGLGGAGMKPDYRRVNRRGQETGSGGRRTSSSTSFSPVPVGFAARTKSQHLSE